MGVKFFGEFLIERGELDGGHVREALELMERTNFSLGEIAVAAGRLSREDADRVNLAQRGADRPFGDLAVEMGVLTAEQLVACLREQRESHLMIGEALVKLGHLAPDRLAPALDGFKTDQAPYAIDAGRVLPDVLANNRIAPYVLDLLPKFAIRMAQVTVKIGAPQVLGEAPTFPFRIALPVHGPRSLEVTLVGDRAFCRKLAAGTAGSRESALGDDLVTDGVGEFLSVLCGNAMSALERDGVATDLVAPDFDAEFSDGWLFDLATSHGRAALVLAQF